MRDLKGLTLEEYEKRLKIYLREAADMKKYGVIPYDEIVSIQNVPYNFDKHTWIIKHKGFNYSARFKKLVHGKKTLGYHLIKEIL